MSFSYPKASVGVTSGNKFYRIRGETIDVAGSGFADVAPGDLIPINVGFHGIAVGPESDYERYELLYTDPLAPGELQSVMFSKDTPFIGGVPSDNSSNYGGLTVPKLAFVRIADSGTRNGGGPRIADASVDLVVYTGAPPSHPNTGRTHKRREGNVPITGGANVFYIPGYGRSYFRAAVSSQAMPIADLTGVQVFGNNLHLPMYSNASFTPGLSGKILVQLEKVELLPSTPIVNPFDPSTFDQATVYVHDARVKGYFDFYEVIIQATGDYLPSSSPTGRGVHVSMEVRD